MRIIAHPVLCNYYVTYRCNAKCGFCDIWERPSPYVNMEDLANNLRDLKRLGVKVIDFTGGEPLLHTEIHDFLGLAKKMGFVTTLTTNGLLYPKKAKQLKGLVDMLHFSLDSPDKDTHDQSRGVACFDLVMQSVRIALNQKERPDILFTVFEDNVHEIKAIYEDICLPNNLVLILNPVFDYNTVRTGEKLSDATLHTLQKWGKRKLVYLNEAFIALRQSGGNHVEDPVCKAASSTIVISPENELVLPCYHLGKKAFPINQDLYNLYLSPAVKNLIALEGRLPECEGCTINCYMQPSFAVEMNKFWWKALPSTLKYNYMKGTWKSLFK